MAVASSQRMGASRWLAIALLLAIAAVATASDAPTLAQEEKVQNRPYKRSCILRP